MLIFLDIDGVMVPAKGWKVPELLQDGFPAFSSKATSTLQKLISEDTTIVLTSSHKAVYSIEKWKEIFNNRNISIARLIRLPDNLDNRSRKEEILDWFSANQVGDDYIIIDDDSSLNELPEFIKDRLVQTSPLIGLTERHLETIGSINAKNRFNQIRL
jgi:16S rRNA C1402 (ribose-2'-O) methylase RsmI